MEKATASARRILELLLTKAVITGKAKSATIKIPFSDLKQDYIGGVNYSDVELVVELKTRWAERDDETLPMEVSEDPNGFDPEAQD